MSLTKEGNTVKSRRIKYLGRVTSAKMDKTVVVKVEGHIRHPKYGKIISRRLSCVAHDEKNQCKEGDIVSIMSTRPLSRTKRYVVLKIVNDKDNK